ncbi:MAG TPA: hypothetical protein VHP12_03725 [Chitinophagaceae bacterium]|nr:hypothetical protein [Chitinophagaceae bacterium]
MSLFILTNKNLKGKWRKLLVTLYALHIILLIGGAILYKQRMISENRFSLLFGIWTAVAVTIVLTEFLFRRSMKGKIKAE